MAVSLGAVIGGFYGCRIEQPGTPRSRELERNPVVAPTNAIPERREMEYSSALVDMGHVEIPGNYDF